jgi:hypothetical protein
METLPFQGERGSNIGLGASSSPLDKDIMRMKL